MGKCYNTTVVNAPVEKVWDRINNFHDMSWCPDVITKIEAVGDKDGTEVGAKRILNDAFHETLASVDEDIYEFSYSIDDGPGPVAKSAVSNYVGVVRLLPVTDSNNTFVEWSSSYESDSDSEVADFCNPIYFALLASLKSGFE